MKVVFWSNYHGQSATTSSMLAVSSYIALNSNKKSILLHNQYSHNMLESYLDIDRVRINKSGKGVDPVSTQIRNRNIRAEEIRDYTVSILGANKLDILTGSNHDEETVHSEIIEIFKGIIELANNFYDFVFVDAHTGFNNYSKNLMKAADVVVICCNQNTVVLDDTKGLLEEIAKINNNILVSIGLYNPESKQTVKNIKGMFKFKEVFCVPYNVGFQNSLNDKKIIEFVHKNRDCKQDDDNYYFIQRLKEISEFFMNRR